MNTYTVERKIRFIRKSISICFLFALFSHCLPLFSEEKEILEIRKYDQAIQKDLNKLTQVKVDYTHKNSHVDETDLLSEQIYFYSKNSEIVRIIGDIVYDCSGSVNELTYKNKQLIFIYSYHWAGCNREGKQNEERFYFKNNKLISWLSSKENNSKSNWKKKETELLKLSNFYKKQFPKSN